MRIRRVRKRDGSETAFDPRKIEASVARAQAHAGHADSGFAGEVAALVELLLGRRYGEPEADADAAAPPAPFDVEEVQDLVEQALIEMGAAAVAKAYILERERRRRSREAIEVRPEPSSRGPRVQAPGGVAPWSKSRIAAALVHEADLPRATAEDVAARVEERVFASGLKRISTALVRELVDNELVDLGLERALKKQRPVGLPRHDLRAILNDPRHPARRAAHAARLDTGAGPDASEDTGPAGIEAAVSGEILRRYAQDDVLPERIAELDRAGEIEVEDLARPHLPLVQTLPCELLLGHTSGDASTRAAFAILDELGAAARATSRGVVLEDCGVLLRALQRGARGAGPLGSFLLAVSGVARASDRRVDLSVRPGSAAGRTWIEHVLEELWSLERDGALGASPRLYLDAEELARAVAETPTIRPAIEGLLRSGRLVPSWSGGGERFAAPGIARVEGERGVLACGGSVALNLPRIARRAGPWREEALLEGIAHAVESALDALAALREFQRQHRDLHGTRARTGYAVAPVGLREALLQIGDGELRPEQAGRVLAFLGEAVERYAGRRGLTVVVATCFGDRARARFAALDRELFTTSQPLLFRSEGRAEGRDEGRAGAELERPYAAGLDLAPRPDESATTSSTLEAGTAALLAVARSGALHPHWILGALPSGFGLADRGDETPWLSAWERLDRQRARLRSGAHTLYALPPLSPTPKTVRPPALFAASDSTGSSGDPR